MILALRPFRTLVLSMCAAAVLHATGAFALALDPFLSPSPESIDAPAVAAMTNDSFGPGPVKEWDDLDSFGLRFSIPVAGVRLLAAASGLTDRTTAAAGANRIDEATFGAAFSVHSTAPLWVSVALGMDATGNFGGLQIQEGIHSETGVQRHVPTAYSGDASVLPLTSFKLLVASDAPLSPYLVAAARSSLPSRGSLLAVAGLRYLRPGALLAASVGWREAGGAGPVTITSVASAESGPYLGFELRVGLLALAFEDIPSIAKSNGSLGIVLGPAPPGGVAPPLSLDLGLTTGGSVAQRVRLAAILTGERSGLYEEVFFSFAQGWFSAETRLGTDTLFAEYSAGGSVGIPFGRGIGHLDLGLGPFASFEQLSTTNLASSVTLGHHDSLGVAADGAIRIALPITVIPLGLGWRVHWRALQADLINAGTPLPPRDSFDFELFVFSQS